jgi:signal transduction histidine kinase
MKLSVGHKLYISVISVFLVFAVAFIVFQQTREKRYKEETLHLQLQDYNDRMHVSLEFLGKTDEETLRNYVKQHNEKNIRVTLIDKSGRVFFDNLRKDYSHIANHSNRTEFIEALKTGQGATVDRKSNTTNVDYFYSATYFPENGYVIRTALPYDNDLAKSLETDQHYIWFALGAFMLLTILLYRFTKRLDRNIQKLRIFALRADNNENIDTDDLIDFSNDELGEIAEKIIKIYRRLETTRKEQDKLKRELTQNVAHELKTPVASIKGFLETIINNPEIDVCTQRQFLERCYAQSERLGVLLQDISTLNRMDNAPEAMCIEDIDVADIVAHIQQETILDLEKHGMSFINNLPKTIIIKGNKSMVYSIFRNLTDNAIAYAGEGTTITLSAIKEKGKWHFTFSDNGIGVPPEHLSRIFERFYRVDKGRSRKMGGTGLGLAIVKNAVLLHGGTITANNQPNGGLKMEFTLSLCSPLQLPSRGESY